MKSAGADVLFRQSEQSGERLFDHLLDRERVLLPLPAGVGRAAVGDDQAVGAQAFHIHPFPVISKTPKGTQIARNSQGISGTPAIFGR